MTGKERYIQSNLAERGGSRSFAGPGVFLRFLVALQCAEELVCFVIPKPSMFSGHVHDSCFRARYRRSIRKSRDSFMPESIITFRLSDTSRFEMLHRVFDALRGAKGDQRINADDESWKSFFDNEAMSHFWNPTPEERNDWLTRWQATPVEKRFADPTLIRPWHFESMIDAFHNGEYNLIALVRRSEQDGELKFEALAWPYGGTGCMHALIECFGGVVTGEVNT